jgi:hypothetical protein
MSEEPLTPAERWRDYVNSLLWQKRSSNVKGTLDDSSYWAFLRAASLGIKSNEAFSEIKIRIEATDEDFDENKVKGQCDRAYGYVGQQPEAYPEFVRQAKAPKPTYRSDKLEAFATRLGFDVSKDYLAIRSKFTPWNRSPTGILHKLYRAGEKVVVFDIFKSQGCAIWQHPGAVGDLSTLDYLATDHDNIWFLCNPVDGLYHHNPRQNSISRRSEESVTSFRYAVVESDDAPKQLWLNMLVQLPLPIAAITDSGGDSIHAVFRVDAEGKIQWDDVVRGKLSAGLVALGADLGALTAVRLTRLGNCHRGVKGAMQRLLYLDDEPDDVPICEKPEREPQTAVLERLRKARQETRKKLAYGS